MANQKLLNKLWFGYITGLIMWIGVTYLDTLMNYLNDSLLAYSFKGTVYTADFLLYYNDAVMSWQCLHDKINVWDAQLQNDYMQKLIPNIELKKIFYSQYPPYLMVLVMPLSLVSLRAALGTFEVLGALGIIFSVYSLLTTTLKGKFERIFTYVAVFASYPAWVCFRLGQIGLAIFPAMMWYWIALDRKYWFRAGLLGGFCMLKLQYAPILFITGCLLGGVRFAGGFVLMGIVYLLGSIAVLGLDNVLRYPEALKMGEISGGIIAGVSPDAQQNLRGQLVILLGNDGHIIHLIVVAVWGVATLFTAWLWWRFRKVSEHLPAEDKRRKFMILASVTMLLQLVTSPHTHRQDYLFVTLPAIWLMYSVVGQYPIGNPAMPGVQNKNLILCIRYMLLGFPILSWMFFTAPNVCSTIHERFGITVPQPPIQPFFLWAVLFLILLGLLIRDSKSAAAELQSKSDWV